MINPARDGVASGRLTADELACLEQNGYVVRENVFSPKEVADITAACEALVARFVQERRRRRYHIGSYTFEPNNEHQIMIKWEGDTDIVHGLEPFAHLDPVLKAWALDARFVEPMCDFVGDAHPSLFTEKLNLKRPGIGGVNPMHQDYPYWIGEAKDPDAWQRRCCSSTTPRSKTAVCALPRAVTIWDGGAIGPIPTSSAPTKSTNRPMPTS